MIVNTDHFTSFPVGRQKQVVFIVETLFGIFEYIVIAKGYGKYIAEIQGQTERIKTRPDVGTCGRCSNRDHG